MSSHPLALRVLDGPPAPGFDCGREAQNLYYHERAWREQSEWRSVTYLLLAGEDCAAYATIAMDSLELGTREKEFHAPYRRIGALKLAQLGVDLRFQGRGYGKLMVGISVALGRRLSRRAGCRYVGLDAEPALVGWYEKLGFRVNKVMQKHRAETAARRGGAEPAVSMRVDIAKSTPFWG